MLEICIQRIYTLFNLRKKLLMFPLLIHVQCWMICIASACNYSIFCYNIEINRYFMQPESLCNITHEWKWKMSALAICTKWFYHILIDVLVKWVEVNIEYDENNIDNYLIEQFHEHKSEKSICNNKLKCFRCDSSSKEFNTVKKKIWNNTMENIYFYREKFESQKVQQIIWWSNSALKRAKKKHGNHCMVWLCSFCVLRVGFMHILCLL